MEQSVSIKTRKEEDSFPAHTALFLFLKLTSLKTLQSYEKKN